MVVSQDLVHLVFLFEVLVPTLSSTFYYHSNMPNGISMEDLLSIKCPVEKPNLCLPYGTCCSLDEFCSSTSRTCESCFPVHIASDKSILLQWCKEIGQFGMDQPSCRLACHARFNTTLLSNGHGFTTDLPAHQEQYVKRFQILLFLCITLAIVLMVVLTYKNVNVYHKKCVKLLITRRPHKILERDLNVTELSQVPTDHEDSRQPELDGTMVKLRKGDDAQKLTVDTEKAPADGSSELDTLFGCDELFCEINSPSSMERGETPDGAFDSDSGVGPANPSSVATSRERPKTLSFSAGLQ